MQREINQLKAHIMDLSHPSKEGGPSKATGELSPVVDSLINIWINSTENIILGVFWSFPITSIHGLFAKSSREVQPQQPRGSNLSQKLIITDTELPESYANFPPEQPDHGPPPGAPEQWGPFVTSTNSPDGTPTDLQDHIRLVCLKPIRPNFDRRESGCKDKRICIDGT